MLFFKTQKIIILTQSAPVSLWIYDHVDVGAGNELLDIG